MRKIKIADITLKTLTASGESTLLFREKTAIAACCDELGMDAVELAAVKNVREDTIIYKTIASKLQNAVLSIPVGFTEEELAVAWECVKDAKHPRLQIALPVSTVQMEYTYHIKAEKMLAKIESLTKAAKALCDDVEFCAVDATRANEGFLVSAIKAAVANGATSVTVCDNAGISLPKAIASLTKTVKAAADVTVYVQVSDRIGMAIANAIEAVGAGADGLKCAMAGKDVLITGAIANTIREIGAQTTLNNTRIHASIEDMLSRINHKAYETENEISEKKQILLDSDSTLSQVAQAATVLGYDLSDADCGNVHKALMQVCEKKGAVGAKELEALVASNAMQAPSTYHLESYVTSCSNLTSSMSQVTLKCNGELMRGVSAGDGPVDSAFRAIEQCIGHHYELDDFQVQAVTEGKEALGSALVKLRNKGKLYAGNGISTDIVAASIRAYINALNKIVAEEE